MLMDQRMPHGAPLTFFGHRAWTALSAAEMAVKYDALIMPGYGLRSGPRGTDFEYVFEPAIPHGDPVTMTQAINDSLERQVRAHMDQWLWLHRRWRDVPRPPSESA
jgi:KDO2-lipid IV(A) lauroyltransferase